jgi:hypothetical protein
VTCAKVRNMVASSTCYRGLLFIADCGESIIKAMAESPVQAQAGAPTCFGLTCAGRGALRPIAITMPLARFQAPESGMLPTIQEIW